jgi:SSS family solute:Na+ symporter
VNVAAPILASIITFVAIGLIRPQRDPEADALIDSLDHDQLEQEPSAPNAVAGR